MSHRHISERRATTRVDVDFTAIDKTHTVSLRACNLSLGGAAFTGTERTPGSILDLELSLPEQNDPLRVRGVVTGSEGGTMRVSFLDLGKREMVKIAEALW
ncbi:MAG: PilZ domain-containing protein [Polyangiaceae bacterium]|nr:PilZ domain-containing protein [Polyangiaceae bacterium]